MSFEYMFMDLCTWLGIACKLEQSVACLTWPGMELLTK